MKKMLVLIAFGLILLAGCSKTDSADMEVSPPAASSSSASIAEASSADSQASGEEDVIEIKEKMFLAQTNEIYLNAEDYMGKTIRYEGFFDTYTDAESGETYCVVIRNGPGCCPGVDNSAGFEVKWDRDLPAVNDWVEVTGVLDEYDVNGWKYLYLKASALNVLDVRGADYVTQ